MVLVAVKFDLFFDLMDFTIDSQLPSLGNNLTVEVIMGRHLESQFRGLVHLLNRLIESVDSDLVLV